MREALNKAPVFGVIGLDLALTTLPLGSARSLPRIVGYRRDLVHHFGGCVAEAALGLLDVEDSE
jgi:hypothetical protein